MTREALKYKKKGLFEISPQKHTLEEIRKPFWKFLRLPHWQRPLEFSL